MKVNLAGYEFEVAGHEWFWPGVDRWEPETFDIIQRFADPEKILLDCGAWNGVISMPASKMYKFVYAFEPDEEAFTILKGNIALNDYLPIITSPYGLSDREGLETLYGNQGNSMSSITSENGKGKRIQTCKLSHFVKIYDGQIGLIKIDIEGAEELVIPEVINSLKKNTPPLYISFHPFWFRNPKSVNHIADILFEVYQCLTPYMESLSKDDFLYGLANNSNSFVFVK